ncbi:MAG: proline--tRNA ligase [Deltaproteobacteria bacterium]|nr:proline--tRNA ligase [Deltaproteobacteria bacterium]
MRFSQMFIPTLREAPAEAQVISHQLMLRAGYIRKLAAGIYTYLPLALKVFRKIEQIVREEMTAAGAQELLLPMVMPAELWQETGRWGVYGKELLRIKDRHDRDFCLGPTHEEAITDLVRHEIRSWRELPKNLFQIQTKFRDEIRPRFGLMRGREFIMKDAYSFDLDEAGAKVSYEKMFAAYEKIFKRCGLKFRAVEAGTGAIGGNLSHEFQVLASTGEDAIFACDKCHYAANAELAEAAKPKKFDPSQNAKLKGEYKTIDTPNLKTAEEVMTVWKKPITQFTKTLIFDSDKGPIAGLVRADRNLKETKLQRLAKLEWCHLADEAAVREITGAPVGFAGPIGLKIPIFADFEVAEMKDFLVGANEKDKHLVEVNLGDFHVEQFGDLRGVEANEECARCNKGKMEEHRGIEVGQVFYLGTKYSHAMKAVVLDQEGKEKTIEMGCYGIGISRTAAAAIEQNHDEKGMIWPLPIAPFHVAVIPLNQDAEVLTTAETIYADLQKAGLEVLLDDRDARAGVKFADFELIGIPYAIVVGSKGLKEGKIEWKSRQAGSVEKIALADVIAHVKNVVIITPYQV